ncbi:MAG: hypothetical protein JW936_00885 [Sedimentisphaerales bacterium]|nr:hypothetical protein [Sedimentisphaerales bacterium]
MKPYAHSITVAILTLLLICPLFAQTPESETPPAAETEIIDPCSPPADPLLPGIINVTSLDPNLAPAIPLNPAPDEPPLANWQAPRQIYLPHYHPHVNQRSFLILSYPYFHQGLDYSENITLPIIDPNTLLSAQPQTLAESYADLVELTDLIHQWRTVNESPGTILEITFAIELTRLATHVYNVAPEIAVQVKRTVGQIAYLNRQFDTAGRVALRSLLEGYDNYQLTAKLKKYLSDIQSLLNNLAVYNDAISSALGAGPIDRSAAWPNDPADFIDYSDLMLPNLQQ